MSILDQLEQSLEWRSMGSTRVEVPDRSRVRAAWRKVKQVRYGLPRPLIDAKVALMTRWVLASGRKLVRICCPDAGERQSDGVYLRIKCVGCPTLVLANRSIRDRASRSEATWFLCDRCQEVSMKVKPALTGQDDDDESYSVGGILVMNKYLFVHINRLLLERVDDKTSA
jgi:hypothetical protein